MGYSREAKELSDTTHRLPIPPAAKGERNYKVILNEIDAFMGSRSELAPLFTIRDQIPIITSFINQFCSFANVDANRYTVYPLHQIFYDIKEEAVKNSISGQSLKSIHIAEALLNRDNYAYQSNMACNVSFCFDFDTFFSFQLTVLGTDPFWNHPTVCVFSICLIFTRKVVEKKE